MKNFQKKKMQILLYLMYYFIQIKKLKEKVINKKKKE